MGATLPLDDREIAHFALLHGIFPQSVAMPLVGQPVTTRYGKRRGTRAISGPASQDPGIGSLRGEGPRDHPYEGPLTGRMHAHSIGD